MAASTKRVTEWDQRRFVDSAYIYKQFCTRNDPKMKKLSEYSACLFSQYFAMACKIGEPEMMATLRVLYEDAPKELIERGEAEARRQGIAIPKYK